MFESEIISYDPFFGAKYHGFNPKIYCETISAETLGAFQSNIHVVFSKYQERFYPFHGATEKNNHTKISNSLKRKKHSNKKPEEEE